MERKNNLALFCIAVFLLIIIINIVYAESAYGETIKGTNYEISRSKVEREVALGEIVRDSVIISNTGELPLRVSIYATSEIADTLTMEEAGGTINSHNSTEFYFTIRGKEIKNYIGNIKIGSDIVKDIPVNITVKNYTSKKSFDLDINPLNSRIIIGDKILMKLNVINLFENNPLGNMSLVYVLKGEDNSTYILLNESNYIKNSYQVMKQFEAPQNISKGFYSLEIFAQNANSKQFASAQIQLVEHFWNILLFGKIPIWLLGTIIFSVLFILLAIYLIQQRIEKNKKYKMQLDTKTLPIKTDRSMWLGKIAETNSPAYLDLDALTTHAVVAGATGGGKSIAAQVLVEEALKNNISVIVFDPTAQWSGMLRKCDDKKMMAFYSKFGMKESDSRAFPGNIRQIQNERQKIDIKKYMTPGNIQVFTMNKLTPPQIDTFVASVIASIFGSDPEEYPNLRTLIVFDEVHRLLPKFGGSGKGFLQIERACREFRKWGFGVMLVSQVLSDFVGEIKANINTEAQMRTRDESDLNRIKTKYGEEFLQSLIKASVGVGMFVNAKYNRGRPYFINFRPILHNTKRLSDEILSQYNKYGEIIDDLEYQLKQLEELKVDIFDLKMELKLVKDKLTSGNFTVVDIYLEEITPRVKETWESIKKKPKKLEMEYVKQEDIASSLAEANKTRGAWKDETKK
ncbi:MAG TPA: helicase HerA-like domain-containing protein [Candidatus Nanoarchaeia archaeon]|nr:helicase HerA-like domain-containing protein [Candidatus Nanoarchaeia archaeon]